MQRIIYSSANKIEWDAQSAFKLTNYYTEVEDRMVFCYLKLYVHNGSLKLCTFCFDKEPAGRHDLELCLNLSPEDNDRYINLKFGIDGIEGITAVNPADGKTFSIDSAQSGIMYSAFKSNDQQGYYWCGEITIPSEFTADFFRTALCEKSIIVLNLYKVFDGSCDYASLFFDPHNKILDRQEYMQEFVVLNY